MFLKIFKKIIKVWNKLITLPEIIPSG